MKDFCFLQKTNIFFKFVSPLLSCRLIWFERFMTDSNFSWFSKERLDKFYDEKFGSDGKLKADAAPLAQGSFAALFRASELHPGSDDFVVRIVAAPPGPSEEYSLQKEVKALNAYLKLCTIPEQAPINDRATYIHREHQPRGLCNIDAYYIDTTTGCKKVFTIMPLGRPLMDVIEEQLVSASEGGEKKPKNLSQLIGWISQIARALKMMHSKGVYWRDCKLDNIILIGDQANVIDINSGVCTVGYASHEQLVKLPISSFTDSQTITDALEQLLQDQPDHQTWETQDVFALSIVTMELLTYGMFTYPYNRDEPAPSYVSLLLYELRVYNLLLSELSDVYDVSALKGRLDRKIKHWQDKVETEIDPTSQNVRDLTLWPLAVTEFRRDKRLFDLWAALAFWDHVDHQFNFIGHWFDWYFDFSEKTVLDTPAQPPAPTLESSVSVAASSAEDKDKMASDTSANDGHRAMEDWRQRAGNISADVDLIKARLQERSERLEQVPSSVFVFARSH